MMKKLSFIIFFLATATLSYGQKSTDADSVKYENHSEFRQPAMSKSQGDSAYINNDYSTAIQVYESLLKGGESADVYYNLGNCYYKIDEIGKAILNYERALLINPGNSDYRANLEIARAKAVDKVTPVPEVFFVMWIKSLRDCLSVDAWARWAVFFFLTFLIGLGLFFFMQKTLLRKIGFIGSMVCIVLFILSNIFAATQKKRLENRNDAIVIQPSVTVRSTPSESGTGLFILHEGSKVKIKDDSMKEWKEIQLEDGKVGWVSIAAVEKI